MAEEETAGRELALFSGADVTAMGSRSVDKGVLRSVCCFLLSHGIPLNAIQSDRFQRMNEKMASQNFPLLTALSDDLWIKDAMDEVKNDIEKFTGYWKKTGCSIMLDEWITVKGKTLLNVSVNCSAGTLFWTSLNISRKNTDEVCDLVRREIGNVGSQYVLQVITSSDEKYVEIGGKLVDSYNHHIFWTPCATNCIDLILEDIERVQEISNFIARCTSITRYIYNNKEILNLLRKYSAGVDIVAVGKSKSATTFMTLERMMLIKKNLKNMVASAEWKESKYSSSYMGENLKKEFEDDCFWIDCGLTVQITRPLLRLLRIVNSEKRSAVGYLYAGLMKAKEKIKHAHAGEVDYYRPYWDIIDKRSAQLQNHPLVAAGFYLNPNFLFSIEGSLDHIKSHIRSLVVNCVNRVSLGPEIANKTVKELDNYEKASSTNYNQPLAVRNRDKFDPAEWWQAFGSKHLADFAARVFRLNCCLMYPKPSHLQFDRLHEVKNSLEQERLSALISFQCNSWLKERRAAKERGFPEALEPLEYADSLTEAWIKNVGLGQLSTLPNSLEISSKGSHVSPPTLPSPILPSEYIQVKDATVDPGDADYYLLGTGFDDPEVFNLHE